MPFHSGARLGPYEVRSLLRTGGMGEVYLAEDTRLNRKVTLKFLLPGGAADDAERMRRFALEAKAASALNHPNILTIYEIGKSEKTNYIAAEYVEGETLRERMTRSRIELGEVLEISVQIAAALSAAHTAGIIHRDIKPENVMVREDGLVKVLDFGLAKLSEPPALSGGFGVDADAETRALVKTTPGMILGTPAYMSPEQARGKETDARTDVFSFGVVLYEMLARRQPFAGETISDVIAALLTHEPAPLQKANPRTPAELERIITKSLAKDRTERYESARGLLTDLKSLQKRIEFETELLREGETGRRREGEKVTKIQPSPFLPVSPSPRLNSVAVLPFSNMSADAENEYFCDGLAEELLNALAKIEDLKVAARTSAFSFKGKNTEVSQIGKTLNVNTVLEGSVRKSGNRLRITVQLVNASDGYHLWSERYDREIADIFDVQDEITLAVVDALKVKLFGDEKAVVLKRHTENQEVYQLYLKGRFFWNKRTDESLRKAIECFQQAIEIEPNYALAYVGLADSYFYLGYSFGFMPPDDAMPKALSAARKAQEFDQTLGEAFCSSGMVKLFYEWDWTSAEEDLRRSIALNPNYPTGYHFYGIYLAAIRRKFDDAIGEASKALNLEPLSIPLHNIVALLLLDARRYDEAIEIWQKALEIAPSNAGLHNEIGWAYELQENYDRAFENYLRALELSGETKEEIKIFQELYESAGIRGIREWKVDFFLKKWEQRNRWHGDAYAIAVNYARLGEKKQSLIWLEKTLEKRSGLLIWLKIQPAFDCLRAEPRFQNLLRRIGLPTDEIAPGQTTNETSEARTAILSPVTTDNDAAVPPDVRKVSDFPGSDFSKSTSGYAARREAKPQEIGESSLSERHSLSAQRTAQPLRESRSDKTSGSADIEKSKRLFIIGLITLLLAAVGLGSYWFFVNRSTKQIESIAVLPFVNESGNADVEYLSDGMTETLIGSLSQLPKLNVKARSSVFRYKGKEADAQTIGGELNVQAILNGRVVQRGEQLTLYLELVDAQTGNRVWGDQYNRKTSDLVALQSEIARDVSNKLKAKLSGADEQKLAKSYTENAEAYQLYLKGRFHWNRRTRKDTEKALDYFNQAIALDPNYALAYVGVAEVYMTWQTFGLPHETMPKAREAALKALSLDDNSAEAHTALGRVMAAYDYDSAGAEREYRRAIELNPNYANAHYWYGQLLMTQGTWEGAFAEHRRALELEPLSLIINTGYGNLLNFSGRYDEAIAHLKKTLELDENFIATHGNLSTAYQLQGNYAEGVEALARERETNGEYEIAALMRESFAKGGREGFLRYMTEDRRATRSFYAVAMFHAALGEKDKAFAELNKSYERRETPLFLIKIDPRLDPLRDDPRLQELLRRVGFSR